uniref:Uncharacterized protein n=1 Tax=Romanomermis culicivorax TaxID=13658 RepID=A0A915HXD5_ROMCU
MTTATMRLMNNVPITHMIDQVVGRTIPLRTIMIKASQSMKKDVHCTAKMTAESRPSYELTHH